MIDAAELERMHATIEGDGGTGLLIRDPVSFTGVGKQPVAQQPNLDTGAPSGGPPIVTTGPTPGPPPDTGGTATFGGNPPSGDAGGSDPITDLPGPIRVPVDGSLPLPLAPPQTSNDPAVTSSGFGVSQNVLDAISATAANAGANQMLGPQYSYGPAPTTTTTAASGGSPILIIVAIAIVGVLAWMHFRKKHAEHS